MRVTDYGQIVGSRDGTILQRTVIRAGFVGIEHDLRTAIGYELESGMPQIFDSHSVTPLIKRRTLSEHRLLRVLQMNPPYDSQFL
jgi:hypothetical protein